MFQMELRAKKSRGKIEDVLEKNTKALIKVSNMFALFQWFRFYAVKKCQVRFFKWHDDNININVETDKHLHHEKLQINGKIKITCLLNDVQICCRV